MDAKYYCCSMRDEINKRININNNIFDIHGLYVFNNLTELLVIFNQKQWNIYNAYCIVELIQDQNIYYVNKIFSAGETKRIFDKMILI